MLAEEFTNQTGTPCEVIISSSGKLTAQILQGAPYDVFLSADMKYPEQLIEAGKALNDVRVYAKGKLILWTTKAEINLDTLINANTLLRSPGIRHVALANPKTAPYGRAAMEVLEHYGLTELLSNKLVYGESIAQTNQFVTTQAAELGFTTKSVIYAPDLQDRGRYLEIPDNIYQPIEQGAIILLTHPAQKDKANAFLDFLQSSEAKQILTNFGYSI